jgi:bleomycin hydrolase
MFITCTRSQRVHDSHSLSLHENGEKSTSRKSGVAVASMRAVAVALSAAPSPGAADASGVAGVDTAAAKAEPEPKTIKNAAAQEVFLSAERVAWLGAPQFGVRVSPRFAPQDQRSTGRCWLFALCNVARVAWRQDISPSFLAFYDSLEKAEHLLKQVALVRRTEQPTGRLLSWLFSSDNLMADGGQWDMAARVMRRHGVCLKSDYADCKAHVATLELRKLSRTRLRFDAISILSAREKSDAQVAEDVAAAVARFRSTLLVPFYGEPPAQLKHGDTTTTPLEFYNSLPLTFRPDDYCCLVNAPDACHPMMKKMTITTLGEDIAYVNVPIDQVVALCELQLLHGVPVWVGVDWDKDRDLASGSLDSAMTEGVRKAFDIPELSKGQMLEFGHSRMTHAVVLVGFDRQPGEEARYRIENSHGLKGKHGFYHASESWLRSYLYEAAIARRFLPREILEVYDGAEVIHLDPWDPLGALAE